MTANDNLAPVEAGTKTFRDPPPPDPVSATAAVAAAAPETAADAPALPSGDPLRWTLEEWFKAIGVPIDEALKALEAAAAAGGLQGAGFHYVQVLFSKYVNAQAVVNGLDLVFQRLAELAVTGSSPITHSDTDLGGA